MEWILRLILTFFVFLIVACAGSAAPQNTTPDQEEPHDAEGVDGGPVDGGPVDEDGSEPQPGPIGMPAPAASEDPYEDENDVDPNSSGDQSTPPSETDALAQ